MFVVNPPAPPAPELLPPPFRPPRPEIPVIIKDPSVDESVDEVPADDVGGLVLEEAPVPPTPSTDNKVLSVGKSIVPVEIPPPPPPPPPPDLLLDAACAPYPPPPPAPTQ